MVNTVGTPVGGLIGYNRGELTRCHSEALVHDTGFCAGGLVGENWDTVAGCYSAGTVGGTARQVGGLIGFSGRGGRSGGGNPAANSFWDTQTSGQTTSAGGTGKTTAEMQTASTFLDAGWDFVDEAENGTADIWSILEDQDYPRLWWELK